MRLPILIVLVASFPAHSAFANDFSFECVGRDPRQMAEARGEFHAYPQRHGKGMIEFRSTFIRSGKTVEIEHRGEAQAWDGYSAEFSAVPDETPAIQGEFNIRQAGRDSFLEVDGFRVDLSCEGEPAKPSSSTTSGNGGWQNPGWPHF
jgi:hypothetical protein